MAKLNNEQAIRKLIQLQEICGNFMANQQKSLNNCVREFLEVNQSINDFTQACVDEAMDQQIIESAEKLQGSFSQHFIETEFKQHDFSKSNIEKELKLRLQAYQIAVENTHDAGLALPDSKSHHARIEQLRNKVDAFEVLHQKTGSDTKGWSYATEVNKEWFRRKYILSKHKATQAERQASYGIMQYTDILVDEIVKLDKRLQEAVAQNKPNESESLSETLYRALDTFDTVSQTQLNDKKSIEQTISAVQSFSLEHDTDKLKNSSGTMIDDLNRQLEKHRQAEQTSHTTKPGR